MDGSDPDRIVFAEPPKWEQELNTLTVQEPLAVEKFYAHNVGRYLRLVLMRIISMVRQEDHL
ncbi:MAG: hypothetical protein CM15mV4_2880 [Caudoviricetes sp.]|nr:MAG: hypothetical protein CM15mV4_2880 [Caudoviricetes sp.]